MLDDGSGAPADKAWKPDLARTFGMDPESTAPRPDAKPDGQQRGVFGAYAYSKGGATSSQLERKDVMPASAWRELCRIPGETSASVPAPAPRRLTSLKDGLPLGKPLAVRRGTDNLDSPSPRAAGGGKRQRSGRENAASGSRSPAAKRRLGQQRPIVGLYAEDEEEDAELLAPPPVAAPPRPPSPAMRVRARADRDYGPGMVDLERVGEVLEEDAADEVLQQCESISARLKAALGGGGGGGDGRLAALEGSTGMASPALLAAACGPAAKYIKGYQLVGINFLLLLAREGVPGSILADEMGLGKTAQTICFLGCLRELFQDDGPHLVICPASLLENWQRELQRWCPSLRVQLYYGPGRGGLRHELRAARHGGVVRPADSDADSASESESEPEWDGGGGASQPQAGGGGPAPPQAGGGGGGGGSAPFNVMLTSYTLFERDSQEQASDRKFLRSWAWSHIVLDEAHAVKNSSAQRTVRLNRLAEQCRRRVLLTGTPLQNDLGELQNLLRFLMPRLFTAEQAAELAAVTDEGETARLAERMQGLLRPFVLRRLKTEVATQLQPKQQRLVSLPMPPEQASLYEACVRELRDSLAPAAATAAEGDAAARQAAAARAVKRLGARRLGNSFVELRKLALHPLLVRRRCDDAGVAALAAVAWRRGLFGQASEAKVRAELLGYSDHQLHTLALENGPAFQRWVLPEAALHASAKCRYLAQLLPELKAAGSRPLIFSQWVVVLDLLEWLLQCLRLPYVRLDGNTAVAERLKTVDLFNNAENGVFAFLLTTRAGGQGLNLTGADTVVLHDVDFNPQVDRQAEDRCHRLGQTRPVTVYRLVTAGTVDEGIQALAERKLRLDAAVLDGITASAQRTKAFENAAMSELLQSLLAGEEGASPEAKAAGEGAVIEIASSPEPESGAAGAAAAGGTQAGRRRTELASPAAAAASGEAAMAAATIVLDTPESSAQQ